MSRGAAKEAALRRKAQQTQVIRRGLRDAAPAEVKPGQAAIERKIEERKPGKLQ